MGWARITPSRAKMATFGDYPVAAHLSNRQMSWQSNALGSGVPTARASDKLKTQDRIKGMPILFPRTLPHFHLLLCLALVLTHATAAQTNPQAGHSGDGLSRPNDALNRAAFDHFYNLDYDRAVQEFDQVLQRHPDDPFAVNHLLTAVLFRELYRMGALNTGEYANDTFVRAAHRPAAPKVKQQIKDLVQRATLLEE